MNKNVISLTKIQIKPSFPTFSWSMIYLLDLNLSNFTCVNVSLKIYDSFQNCPTTYVIDEFAKFDNFSRN